MVRYRPGSGATRSKSTAPAAKGTRYSRRASSGSFVRVPGKSSRASNRSSTAAAVAKGATKLGAARPAAASARSRDDLRVTLMLGGETVVVRVEIGPGPDGEPLVAVHPVDEASSHSGIPMLLERAVGAMSRESRLERTAARFGLPTEALLAGLADSAVDVTDASQGLPAAELNALLDAGITLEGPAGDPSGAGSVAAGLARGHRLRESALTVAQAASALGVTPSRVRQLVASGALVTASRTSGAIGTDSGHLLPSWQIVEGHLVPGLSTVARAAAGLHPLSLAGFMTRPDVDLEVDGQPVSPVEWLLTGGDPVVVADLAAGLLAAS